MNKRLTCPKCSHSFPLDEALNRDLEKHLRQKISAEFESKTAEMRQRPQAEAADQTSRILAELKAQVETQTRELSEAREQERALIRAKAELQAQAEKAELQAERKLAEERDRIRRTAQQEILDQHQLRDADKNKQLDDLRRQIEELKRKAEQGPQQRQGEVQELELEKALRAQFPNDKIEPIKSGVRGADIVQTVMSDDGKPCGRILWESKRVRHWSDTFVNKLLADKAEAKADLGVIVSDVLPSDVTYLGCDKGVLLTTFSLAVCLASTLRVNMSLLGQTRWALSGREDQKSRLFEYFLSPGFHEQMRLMGDQLTQMQEDLRKEKASITRTWAKRQQQIEAVTSGTAGLVGTLQALCGPAMPAIPQFELCVGEEV